VEKYGTAGQPTEDIIQRMCFGCWVKKATDTHSEYVTLIALPRHQLLREYVRCPSFFQGMLDIKYRNESEKTTT
jgi:hypothetical protein